MPVGSPTCVPRHDPWNTGESIHLAPNECLREIDGIEIADNRWLDQLQRQHLVVPRPGRPRRGAESARDRAPAARTQSLERGGKSMELLHPGVYIQEVSGGIRPIEGQHLDRGGLSARRPRARSTAPSW